MQYFTLQEARTKAKISTFELRSPQKILKEEYDSFNKNKAYDIFLSHSYSDAELVLGAAEILRKPGYSVYIDWIEDANLDRKNVTKEVADLIRKRMKACKSLVYVTSENSSNSKWMPWELGYFDGFKPNCVAILPLVTSNITKFKGQEYLSLYPVITKGLPLNSIGLQDEIKLNIYDGMQEKIFKVSA